MMCKRSGEQAGHPRSGSGSMEEARFAVKWLFVRRLVILVAVALTAAGGCSNQSETAIPVETKPAPSKSAADEKNEMSVSKEAYDKMPDGIQIDQYTLSNPNGLKVKLINYGAIVTAVETPDRNGKIENITLYRDSLADYMEMKDGKPTTPYFGATVGRYGNRIAKGRFTLDGKEYTLAVNNGPNALHGGLKGLTRSSGRPSQSRPPTRPAWFSPIPVRTVKKAIPVRSRSRSPTA